MKKLKLHQYNVISRFCEDIAKGLMLAVILGQMAIANLTPLERVLSILTSIVLALLLLFFAIYFSKER
ncbi:MAG: hypothetical protein UR39_C0005G0068 [Candidatus Woesebacteria bacterium GW2011_GWA1_33_30]|uniref:Uncharacterized protein n=1 Tax=Candidatus Woesebacteria bacterium GW2011_GWA2_33_28 TaxID=1618561 RepID=A0A0G0C7N4_9BACT|nr:MAG: hypothetical protein UR38_C0005G0068 [Candidatus Woesebacteria bacterium GW2011_GWA2_33_28]KKP48186.1 MAG: hypothetical protein UR39_C0005G0068 [Candidatus Woesebacteria bacterium GW2011_GWA1_33_30]KKP49428.1 MAG: hypothetical protein UR40_C0006G0068 [Microgenomates group bacterium GW2011_GWC1_33_32]KKP52154.1 MAG: hypothetical protein UR44_C0004G0068 [Candidatus Woesebacteria bacterium GW2011_GWB1_33_38]KKP56040.1 MAG: hypothetical protein UR48_C0042G0004 [Microgenomates group bacteriu